MTNHAEKSHPRHGVIVVIGGQFGSEGKGDFVTYLASRIVPSAVVRIGGPNAGHTMTLQTPDASGGGFSMRKFPMRQLPCGWHVPRCWLVIGPGSVVDPDVLFEDIELAVSSGFVSRENVLKRLAIDNQATWLTEKHKDAERVADLVSRIGSTGKGIGGARSDRIMRTAKIVADCGALNEWTRDTTKVLSACRSLGPIIVETAQGFGLSLHLSGHYPYCTSADISPGHALGDAGMSSRVAHRVVAVVRSFPIRVAGNSGVLFAESSWQELHDEFPSIPESGEQTTVTKKIRRVGRFDINAVKQMADVCQPDYFCLTFADYLDPRAAEATSWDDLRRLPAVYNMVAALERTTNTPVGWVSVGAGRIINIRPRCESELQGV